jgi:hypothetical protein
MKIVSGDRVLSVERSAHELETKRRGSWQSQMSQVLKRPSSLPGGIAGSLGFEGWGGTMSDTIGCEILPAKATTSPPG